MGMRKLSLVWLPLKVEELGFQSRPVLLPSLTALLSPLPSLSSSSKLPPSLLPLSLSASPPTLCPPLISFLSLLDRWIDN